MYNTYKNTTIELERKHKSLFSSFQIGIPVKYENIMANTLDDESHLNLLWVQMYLVCLQGCKG